MWSWEHDYFIMNMATDDSYLLVYDIDYSLLLYEKYHWIKQNTLILLEY